MTPFDSNRPAGQKPRHRAYCPPPNTLPAFPNAMRIRPKGSRVRWRDDHGVLLEWDSEAGMLAMYGLHGWHLGDFDHVRGENLKLAEPGRRIDR